MHTEKWKSISDVSGVNLMLPPGVPPRSMEGGTNGARSYRNEHGLVILVGSGGGPRLVGDACEVVIDGRHASITTRVQKNQIEALAEFESTATDGPEFVYYGIGGYNALHMVDAPALRQIFWTITFTGRARALAATPKVAPTVVTPVAASAVLAMGQSCAARSDARAPAAGEVVDTALIQSLLASSPPIPPGFEVMQMRFGSDGSLAGISATESTFPDAVQRELLTLVATNVKTHDASSPARLQLRVDVDAAGLRYTTLPGASCGT